jgi:hypothetical protein
LKIDNSPKLTAWRSVRNGSIRRTRYVGRIIECVTEIGRRAIEYAKLKEPWVFVTR